MHNPVLSKKIITYTQNTTDHHRMLLNASLLLCIHIPPIRLWKKICNVEKFDISKCYRCGEIWSFSTFDIPYSISIFHQQIRGKNTKNGWKQANIIGFCTHFAPLFYLYLYDPLINIDTSPRLLIDINIDIFQNCLVDIDIDIDIFQNCLIDIERYFQKWPWRYRYFSKVSIYGQSMPPPPPSPPRFCTGCFF